MAENLLAMQETQVQSLGWEDPLREGMATHSIILVWRILWTEKPGKFTVHGICNNQCLVTFHNFCFYHLHPGQHHFSPALLYLDVSLVFSAFFSCLLFIWSCHYLFSSQITKTLSRNNTVTSSINFKMVHTKTNEP